MSRARIKLESRSDKELDGVCGEIIDIAKKSGVAVSGPVMLPTKRLKISTMRSPCGDGSETYEKWELRIHKRLIDIEADDKVLRSVMRIKIPYSVNIEMTLG